MIRETPFGSGPKGESLRQFTLTSPGGLEVSVTNFGGIVTSILVPDRRGQRADVALGFTSIEPYLAGHPYFGAIIGRIAGRLTPAEFSLDGTRWAVAANQFPHHLHGGREGFDRRVWEARAHRGPEGDELVLNYLSPEGEEGYPGNVAVEVGFSVSDDNALAIRYDATTDRPTPLSLTNHAYFNLGGESAGSVRSHQLQILADEYTPVAPDFAPLGVRRSIAGGANDFRLPAQLDARLDGLFGQHGDNYLLPKVTGSGAVARVFEPESGRFLDVFTTERCLQFYTGVNLDGSVIGKKGRPYAKFAGFCLECQGYPAAPHYPNFDSIILRPGQRYRQRTQYRFGVAASRDFPPLRSGA